MADDYFNQGWFGRHPFFYEIGSFFIAPIRKIGVKKLGTKPLNVIDIATGTGAHALLLAKAGHSVTGIDLDAAMLAKAARKVSPRLSLQFQLADATQLPYADNAFDVATISFAIHDVPPEIAVAMLQEALRVIKPGGWIQIVDYFEPINNPGARLLHWIAHWYESPNYFPFVKVGLASYLPACGLQQVTKTNFLGAVQYTALQKA